MKFFEGLKKVGKKTALGTGIFVASVSALKTSGQETSSFLNTDSNQTEISSDEYRQNFIKYMEHPSYKQRLAKEMFGDEKIDKEKKKKIDEEFERRLEKIRNVPIKMMPDLPKEDEYKDPSGYNPITDTIEATPHAIRHEFQHKIDFDSGLEIKQGGFEKIKNSFVGDAEENYFNFLESQETKQHNLDKISLAKIIKEYILNNKDSIDFKIKVDEYFYDPDYKTSYDYVLAMTEEVSGIEMHQFKSYFNDEDQKKIHFENKELIDRMKDYMDKLNELIGNYNYYGKSTEIKARLTYLRLRAKNEFNFNLKKDFDINKYTELKNDRQYKELRDKLHLTDEQINELIKYTALNATEDPKTHYSPKFWEIPNEEENQT
jgi:hypothetical protein